MKTTTRTQIRTRWPEPLGLGFRQPREPAQPAPASRQAQHDFLVTNLRPDLLEPEPRPRFTLYPIDLP